MTDLFVHTWGTGTPVVLVHGSLATGAEEWEAQQPLADEGFRLLALDRRGYRQSPTVDGEDYLQDADDIVDLLGDGAHLVGHSYGGLGAMVAAAQRPESTLSLALLEPPALTMDEHDQAAQALIGQVRSMWDQNLPDDEWLVRFLEAVGTDPATLPPGMLDEAGPLVPLVRNSRPAWDHDPPLAELASAPFPKLVVSGGHHSGWNGICDALAERIDASRAEVTGAGHEIQFTGAPINQMLLDLWRSTS
ncbi:MAG: alpha/beta fold hydrolase [Candidatus Limnocylindrales bacterium]